MKRSLILGLFSMAVILFACNDKATTDSTATTTNSADNSKEMLDNNRKVLTAIETGDSATLRQHIADDATDHGGGENGADMKGPEIVKMLADVHNHITNLKFEVVQEAANGDHVFSLTKMTGTVKDPIWGMPAGMQCDMTSVDVIKIKDGKMVDHWSYMNPADMMKMMPPPPPTAKTGSK